MATQADRAFPRTRPGFRRLFQQSERGGGGIVMALEFSRLTRNVSGWQQLVDACALNDRLVLCQGKPLQSSDLRDRVLLDCPETIPGPQHSPGNKRSQRHEWRATAKVTTDHLERDSYLCVRQSIQRSVENAESTERQHAFRQRAVALGWPTERVIVIDIDQAIPAQRLRIGKMSNSWA